MFNLMSKNNKFEQINEIFELKSINYNLQAIQLNEIDNNSEYDYTEEEENLSQAESSSSESSIVENENEDEVGVEVEKEESVHKKSTQVLTSLLNRLD